MISRFLRHSPDSRHSSDSVEHKLSRWINLWASSLPLMPSLCISEPHFSNLLVKPMASFELDHPLESMACRSAAPNSCPAYTYCFHLGIPDRPGIRDLDDVKTSASSQFIYIYIYIERERDNQETLLPSQAAACLLLVSFSPSGVC